MASEIKLEIGNQIQTTESSQGGKTNFKKKEGQLKEMKIVPGAAHEFSETLKEKREICGGKEDNDGNN
jgi:hypothetical protein